MNYTLEAVEPVSWDLTSAPNASFTGLLAILKNCPQHGEGIQFTYLADIHPDPHYSWRVEYDGQEGPKGVYVCALIGSKKGSTTESVGADVFKVTTRDVSDIANPEGSIEKPIGNHQLVGYCSVSNVGEFRLDSRLLLDG